MKKNFMCTFILSLGILLFASIGPAWGQDEEPTVYTQVGLWDVHRGQWGDFVDFFETHEAPVLERMVEEGVIVEWGFDANGLHDPNDYSHASWISAHSLAGVEQALQAYSASLGDRANELEAEFADMLIKHKDLVVRSRFNRSRTVRLQGGYSFGTSVRIKRGEGAEYRRAWEKWSKPVLDRLLADGVIVGYTLDTAYHHTDADSLGRYWTWYVVEDIANQETVEAAFDASWEGMSEAERESRSSHYWGMVVEESHRDGFGRIIHFQTR